MDTPDEDTPDGTDAGSDLQRGGQLNVATFAHQQTISSLHSQMNIATSGLTGKMAYAWAEKLVEFDDAGELVPRLATDWELTEDGTITFTLREGVQFHPPYDYEMTADDVEATFLAAMQRDSQSGFYPYAQGIFVDGDTGQSPEDAIEVHGDYEISFHGADFNSSIPWLFTLYEGYIVPAQAYEDHSPSEFGRPDVGLWGTGPFTFDESVAQNSYLFTKFDDYWREGADGDPLPYLDSLRFTLHPNLQSRYSALTSGDADVAIRIPSNRVSDIEDLGDYDLVQSGGTRALRLVNNTRHWEPGQSPEFRQGIAYAIDPNPINESIMSGQAELNDAGLPPWHGMYQEADEEGRITHYEQDVDRARELFAESGFEPPLDEGYGILGTEQSVQRDHTALAIIDQQLSRIGFDPDAQPLIDSEGATAWEWGGPPEGHSQFLYGGDSEQPDPYQFFRFWRPDFYLNRSQYGSPLVEEARSTVDPDERWEVWKDLLVEINQELPTYPMMWFPRLWAKASNVRNTTAGNFGEFKFNHSWIEQ